MKAKINFDFSELFFYYRDVYEDKNNLNDVVEVSLADVKDFKEGDEVEILKIIESEQFPNNKGYVIYNPKNHASTTVGYHVLSFIEVQ